MATLGRDLIGQRVRVKAIDPELPRLAAVRASWRKFVGDFDQRIMMRYGGGQQGVDRARYYGDRRVAADVIGVFQRSLGWEEPSCQIKVAARSVDGE